MLASLAGRRSRRWSDLKIAQLTGFKDTGRRFAGALELRFYSGGSVKLKLHRMAKTEPEKILLALDVWAPQCLRNEELISTHKLLTCSSDGGPSYTQMWEEELRRRFFPTSFVPLEAGAKLRDDRLTIVRQLAFGGLSALYLAQWDNRNLVVLKEAVVPHTVQAEAREKALAMFDREATLLAQMDHPAISKVLDHFVENQRHYILLEHIPGQDLRQYVIENGAVPEAKVLAWTTEVCDILSYLHSQKPPILHRDLTPENLIVNNRQKILLIDFGAANEFLGTATGTVVGKQAYISPEQFRGKSCPQTDIYALGATMYFLLTGLDPEPLSTLELPDSRIYSDAVRSIVRGCTQLELAERFADANQVKTSLQRARSRTNSIKEAS